MLPLQLLFIAIFCAFWIARVSSFLSFSQNFPSGLLSSSTIKFRSTILFAKKAKTKKVKKVYNNGNKGNQKKKGKGKDDDKDEDEEGSVALPPNLLVERPYIPVEHHPIPFEYDPSKFRPTDRKLHFYIEERDFGTLKQLINSHRVNERDKFIRTPLMMTCKDGNYELSEYLLQYGANVEAKDSFGYTAIMYACELGDTKLVSLLADFDSPLQMGVTPGKESQADGPLHCAARSGHIEVLKLILDRIATRPNEPRLQIDQYSSRFLTPLVEACKGQTDGHTQCARLLIQRGADINKRSLDMTPLMASCLSGNLATLNLLLAKGANVNEFAGHGYPVLYAAKNGHLDSLQRLIENNVDLSVRDFYGRTALAVAVMHNKTEIVQLLLNKGADCELVDLFEETPLMHASRAGSLNMVNLLLTAGAEIEVLNNKSLTASQLTNDTTIKDLFKKFAEFPKNFRKTDKIKTVIANNSSTNVLQPQDSTSFIKKNNTSIKTSNSTNIEKRSYVKRNVSLEVPVVNEKIKKKIKAEVKNDQHAKES